MGTQCKVVLLQEVLGPLKTAFSLGLQYPPLAKAALAALERWESEQAQALRAIAPQIVPLLDPYLLEVTDFVVDSDASTDTKGEPVACSWCSVLLIQHAVFSELVRYTFMTEREMICHMQSFLS